MVANAKCRFPRVLHCLQNADCLTADCDTAFPKLKLATDCKFHFYFTMCSRGLRFLLWSADSYEEQIAYCKLLTPLPEPGTHEDAAHGQDAPPTAGALTSPRQSQLRAPHAQPRPAPTYIHPTSLRTHGPWSERVRMSSARSTISASAMTPAKTMRCMWYASRVAGAAAQSSSVPSRSPPPHSSRTNPTRSHCRLHTVALHDAGPEASAHHIRRRLILTVLLTYSKVRSHAGPLARGRRGTLQS